MGIFWMKKSEKVFVISCLKFVNLTSPNFLTWRINNFGHKYHSILLFTCVFFFFKVFFVRKKMKKFLFKMGIFFNEKNGRLDLSFHFLNYKISLFHFSTWRIIYYLNVYFKRKYYFYKIKKIHVDFVLSNPLSYNIKLKLYLWKCCKPTIFIKITFTWHKLLKKYLWWMRQNNSYI